MVTVHEFVTEITVTVENLFVPLPAPVAGSWDYLAVAHGVAFVCQAHGQHSTPSNWRTERTGGISVLWASDVRPDQELCQWRSGNPDTHSYQYPG